MKHLKNITCLPQRACAEPIEVEVLRKLSERRWTPANLLTVVLFLFSFAPLLAQNSTKEIDWKFLSKVDFVDKFYAEYEAWYLFPEFTEPIKKLDGKKVKIKGYVIPLDVEDNLYALSAYPFSSCFFCGGAGPESVMSLKFKGKPRHFDTDDVATFEGTLHLNTTDLDTFNYVLQNAEEVD